MGGLFSSYLIESTMHLLCLPMVKREPLIIIGGLLRKGKAYLRISRVSVTTVKGKRFFHILQYLPYCNLSPA